MKFPSNLALPAFLSILSLHCSAQTYSFDEASDAGWEHLDPLSEAGLPPGTYTFPDGGYRLMRPASPSPDDVGVARIGSFRPDVIQEGDFYISADVTSWDDTEDQNIGLLAMITEPGLGKTNGYALTLDLSEQSLYLALIDFEMAAILTNTPLDEPLTPETGFRIVFSRTDGEFDGSIFSHADLSAPLATVEGFDDFFEKGSPGLFASVDPAEGSVDATFDNFSLSPGGEELGPLTISHVILEDETLTLEFGPVDKDSEYILDASPDLTEWNEVTDSFESGPTADSGVFEIPLSDAPALLYYRVSEAQ